MILRALERLHPEFYPVPHNVSMIDNSIILDDVVEDYLSKKELLTLYGRVGDLLHRGSLRRLLGKTNDIPFDSLYHANRIERLLRTHRISSLNKKVHIICSISYALNDGKSFCALAQSPE